LENYGNVVEKGGVNPAPAQGGDTTLGSLLAGLRKSDRDRFLCALAAPAELRADLATLYAFNAEIAGIADKVTEPMLGLIRLQWWRDALNDIAAGRPHRHQLVQALGDIARRRGLDLARLAGLLDAREADGDAAPPADLAALEAYAAGTAGILCEAALEICVHGPGNDQRGIARQIGTAYGLVGLLRATPYLARRRIIRLPAAAMAAAQSSPDRLCDLKPDAQLPTVFAGVAERAAALLVEAGRKKYHRQAIPALLPGRLARAQLERLRRHGYDPFASGAIDGSGLDIWRLLFARWTGRL
jgi:NADH dehydrogenase [ubiquinone] 1 alpha subcomplex assembly factor 6